MNAEDRQLILWHQVLQDTPLRSMEDIRADREPAWVKPVLALAMQREVPPPPRLFSGPPWWRIRDWLVWNLGDLLMNWSIRGYQQDRERHRLV